VKGNVAVGVNRDNPELKRDLLAIFCCGQRKDKEHLGFGFLEHAEAIIAGGVKGWML
jgi:hypothetical protein